MKKFLLITMLLFAAPAAAQDDFIPNLGDVPMMEGMKEVVDERLVFDTPEGTVAEATLDGPMSADAVFLFYGNSLKALGWKQREDLIKPESRQFEKYGQRLVIIVTYNSQVKLRSLPIQAAD